ncbi:hypothetical protein [Streptomyces scopuliridis]|uniref:hypothetical protein n=1 Tax=Streptomyces scopuliridis TaxID=452529 RepID=UPI0036B836E1
MDDEIPPPSQDCITICRNAECPNNGVPFRTTLYLQQPGGALSVVVCGPCDTVISDVVPLAET